MAASDIGLIGLAVMGENLALNMESKGFKVSVYNRTTEVTDSFAKGRARGKNIYPARTLEEFVNSLLPPRKIQIMVKAGAPVDEVIDLLLPLLEEGDVIIDGGNSLWTDTQRHEKRLSSLGLNFLGVGISGGEEGALNGPAIMPGGSRIGWNAVSSIYQKIAAQFEGEACCRYLGEDGAGHYVKMIHNGIEYADMELICEASHILHIVLQKDSTELAAIFSSWGQGELDSYLIDVTSKILSYRDDETGRPLVDLILDKAGQKGTGKWAVGHANDMGVPISVIASAVESRILSSMKRERVAASEVLAGPPPSTYAGDHASFIEAMGDALYAGKIMSYAQGFAQLASASKLYAWDLDLVDVASLWRGGCIIRARILNEIIKAYRMNPTLKSLILDSYFRDTLERTQSNWRKVLQIAIEHGIPAPALSSALSFYDSYRTAHLPHNLLQAQRDYFGSHRYQRVDKPEDVFFHTNWLSHPPG